MNFDDHFSEAKRMQRVVFWVALSVNLAVGAMMMALIGLAIAWLWNHL